MELRHLIDKVEKWAIERGLDETDPKTQALKLVEEVGELAGGLLKDKENIVKDSLGDILVVLIILHLQLELTVGETLSIAWDEIKDRRGKTQNGTFIKEQDL